MKQMTKRDIADIVLVWIAVSFIVSMVTSIITLGAIIGLHDDQAKFIDKSVSITAQIVHFILLLIINYLLLFKRQTILNIIFPDANEKEIQVPTGLISLTSYSFWIRLFGLFTLLSSGVAFLSDFLANLTTEG